MGYYPNVAIEALTPADFRAFFFRDFPYLPSYDATKAYFVDDKILYTNSNFYKCLQNCTGIAPDGVYIEPTSGVFICGVPDTLEAFKAITVNGCVDLTIDGNTHTLMGMDFSEATSYDDVAQIITDTLNTVPADPSGYVTYDPDVNNGSGGFIITSASTGVNSIVLAPSGGAVE